MTILTLLMLTCHAISNQFFLKPNEDSADYLAGNRTKEAALAAAY